jgi:hypothetical protein
MYGVANHGVHGRPGVQGAQFSVRMRSGKNAEYFIREALAHILDMFEVEFDEPEFIEAHQ